MSTNNNTSVLVGSLMVLAAVAGLALMIVSQTSTSSKAPVKQTMTPAQDSAQSERLARALERDYKEQQSAQRKQTTAYIAGGCVHYPYQYGATVGDTSRAYKVMTFYHEARGQFSSVGPVGDDWMAGWNEGNARAHTLSAEQLRVKYNQCLSLLPYNIQ